MLSLLHWEYSVISLQMAEAARRRVLCKALGCFSSAAYILPYYLIV